MKALVVAMLVLASVASARGDTSARPRASIVLVGGDAELVRALEDLFYAEDTGVTAIESRHTPDLADLSLVSRELADTHGGVATVWLQPSARGATLVTYDRGVDRFAVRDVPYSLPLTATQAAETARMVRTMLRALREQHDDAVVAPAPVRVVPSTPGEPQWLPSAGLGVWLGAPGATAAPMATVALAWRPHGIGASVRATFAPASDLATMTFTGDASELSVNAAVHRALTLAPRVRVTPSLGAGIHVVSLGGRFTGGDPVDSRRVNPSLHLGTVVGIALAHRLELGALVAVDCLLRRQRYATGTEELLEVGRIEGILGIVLGARL